ncbi:MAG: thioredoxin-disulfide reductase [Desulfovibrionaceae bacterium]|nr:thioredoxin-disulfide reductase [Desulfovibrionaceae bacterium]MDD4953023.1 thioredoxin-disulfide reductase [Desulfovibrionaceae bacterium]
MKSYDAMVIGGGPAGLTAMLYLLRAGVDALLVEKLSPGGQVLMTEEIENYPGFPKGIKGFELADLFAAQIDRYPHDRIMDEVSEIRPGQGAHVVRVGPETIEAKTVILCSGARYRKLDIPGERELAGRGVSYCALCDGNFFRDKVVAVIGGGNSALEESLYLARLVRRLHLVHRRDEFRGERYLQDKCFANPKIEVLRSSVPREIVGQGEVSGLVIEDLKSGERRTLEVDGCFIFVGFEPILEFAPPEIKRDAVGIITDSEMNTSVPGIFAAGDVRSKNCRQVVTAVGDGATAASSAFAYLEKLNVS